MPNLSGKVAVITGGASGIGKAMASRFASADMRLTLVDIEAAPLEATAEELRSKGAEVQTEVVDVADADAMDGLREAVLSNYGAVHLVCNNAGVAASGPMWELTEADWTFTFGANLWGVIHGVRVFGKLLVEQDEGHFVNTASMAGLVSGPGMGAYNVTKYGVVALSETLYADLRVARSNVGVSVLCPAFVRTQIWNSERNRPPHLRNPSKATDKDDEAREMLRNVIENSMPTEPAADRVYDAVLANQLYIITHEATRPALEARLQAILAGENPKNYAIPLDQLMK